MEVDASSTGVEGILSQRSAHDNKLHPCSFFLHCLTPTEANYSIGDRELLDIKLPLEEWRHWLEGLEVSFLVWTEHKNLKYLRGAQWSLFFIRLNFTLSYRPGSKNYRTDVLSRQFMPNQDSIPCDTILPYPACSQQHTRH